METLKYRVNADSEWKEIIAIKGDKGEPGEQGPQGPQGEKGDGGYVTPVINPYFKFDIGSYISFYDDIDQDGVGNDSWGDPTIHYSDLIPIFNTIINNHLHGISWGLTLISYYEGSLDFKMTSIDVTDPNNSVAKMNGVKKVTSYLKDNAPTNVSITINGTYLDDVFTVTGFNITAKEVNPDPTYATQEYVDNAIAALVDGDEVSY